ncbi:MAG: efflux RND transporter periplasmic adaptor subunit [Microcoleaceae cyanobacterium]
MNSTPQNSTQPRLKVVPPTVKEQPKPQEKPVQSPLKQTPQKYTFPKQWIAWGVVLLGLGGIGMIPVNHSISGKTTITSTVGKRQSVTMPETGILTLHVNSNQTVKPGDVLATVLSSDLENQKAATSQRIAEAKTAVNKAQQQLMLAQTRLEVANTLELIAIKNMNRKQQEFNNSKLSSGTPIIRAIEGGKAEIESEIIGIEKEIYRLKSEKVDLENEKAKTENKIEQLKKELEKIKSDLEKLNPLKEQGIIGSYYPLLNNLESKARELENQIDLEEDYSIKSHQEKINQKENQISQARESINQPKQQIRVKLEEINQVIEELEKQLEEAEDIVEQKTIERRFAQQEVDASLAEIADKQDLLSQQEDELKRLEQYQEQLTIKATVSGTVTASDLDLRDRSSLEAGREILSVVNLSNLTGLVEVKQEEIDLIDQSLPVTFKPRQATVKQYQAKIADIQPVIQSDESGQNSVLQIRITIENNDRQLQPGLEGVAHIQTPKLRVYQKISREVLKLFPWWKL